MTGNELLNRLDANQKSIDAKNLEIKGYQDEYTATLAAIDNTKNVLIPAAKKEYALAVAGVNTAQATYQATVGGYDKLKQEAITKRDAAVKNASDNYIRTTQWQNHRDIGSKISPTLGAQGYWAGKWGANATGRACWDKAPEWGAALADEIPYRAPSFADNGNDRCNSSDSRRQRRQYAESKVFSHSSAQAGLNSLKTSAESDYTKAVKAYDDAVLDKTVITEANKEATDAQRWVNDLQTKELPKLQGRITWINLQIAEKNKELNTLESVRDVTEFNYRKFVADETARQKVIDENMAVSQGIRNKTELLTKGAIEADIRDSRPKTSEEIQASKQKTMFGVIALGIIVAGIYIIKRNNN
jgi:hypothetical protein